jgi:hypothetical protein
MTGLPSTVNGLLMVEAGEQCDLFSRHAKQVITL